LTGASNDRAIDHSCDHGFPKFIVFQNSPVSPRLAGFSLFLTNLRRQPQPIPQSTFSGQENDAWHQHKEVSKRPTNNDELHSTNICSGNFSVRKSGVTSSSRYNKKQRADPSVILFTR